ncbi:hypothetical protein BS50DRAFT_538210 [Corynespora cassiicola Philippines]|uniref:BTB domain-containing protein n=1 Tax=Corynespora cassiicola Philippines TaxID=1448308 RepID=A0A2T2N090_CORCC|nr:hypothetical protein BS50DRAFT_538210 [Corynespora cassiicola Philippines]
MATNIRAIRERLLSGISRLRDQEQFTDLVLAHDDGDFNVHRVIVCPQSKVLHKACTGGFEETFSGVIHMEHMSHIELERMVAFFYEADYVEDLPDGAEVSPLQLHVRMFALADQYDIPDLGMIAAKKYSSRCTKPWIPMEFLESVRDVYDTTLMSNRTLRDMVCMTIRKHLPQMLDDEGIAELYEETLAESPEFAKDLLKSYVDCPFYGGCIACGSNQPMEALQARCKNCGKGTSGLRSCLD